MEAEILALAKNFLPGEIADDALTVLEKLCAAALEMFRRQLRCSEEEFASFLQAAQAFVATAFAG